MVSCPEFLFKAKEAHNCNTAVGFLCTKKGKKKAKLMVAVVIDQAAGDNNLTFGFS